jgi:ATP-dependent DNA helicase DinG
METVMTPGDPVWGKAGLIDRCAGGTYSARPAQIGMADLVGRLLERTHAPDSPPVIAMAEAETGTGKTLAYMVPLCLDLARNGGRALIGTSTLALMRQIADPHGDGGLALRAANEETGVSLRVGQMRGRRNFISASRCRDIGEERVELGDPLGLRLIALADEVEADNATAACLIGTGASDREVMDCVNAGLIDMREEALGLALPAEDICLTATCPEPEQAIWKLCREHAGSCDILLTTHATIAIHLMRRKLPGAAGAEDETFRLLVIDEADLWPLAAASATGTEMSLGSLSMMLRGALESLRDAPASVRGLSADAAETMILVDEIARHAPAERGKTAPLSPSFPSGLLADVGNSVRRIADALKNRQLAASLRGHLGTMLWSIERLQSVIVGDGSDFWKACWQTSPGRGLPSLVLRASSPGRMLKSVWTSDKTPLARAILLTSATLTVPGFRDEKGWLNAGFASGIDMGDDDLAPAELRGRFAPDDFGQLIYRPAWPGWPVPSPGKAQRLGQDALDNIVSVIEAARTEGGRILVPVPSYRDVEQIGPLIEGAILHIQGTSIRSHLADYIARPDAILISPAVWVGVDLPGFVDHLVIPRLPFPPPAENHDAIEVSDIAATLMKLTQGIGRAIRHADWKASFWCADPRMPPPPALLERDMLAPGKPAKPLYLAAIPRRFRDLYEMQDGFCEWAVKSSKAKECA